MDANLKNILFDGEEVLWQGTPKKSCYIVRNFSSLLPIAFFFLIFDGFFISIFLSTGIPKELYGFLIGFFAIHLLPVWKCISKIITSSIEYKNIVYVITNRRVITRTGIVGLDFESIDYADMSNVRVDVSILERLFKVGTIFISTEKNMSFAMNRNAMTNVNLFQFCAIEKPYEVYKILNKIYVDMKSDIQYPNAMRPETNPGYHSKYNNPF